MSGPRRLSSMLALVLAISSAGACARQTPDADKPLLDVEDPDVSGVRRSDGDAEAPPADVEPEGPRRRAGQIARVDLDRVLDAGKGRYLGTIEVKAHVVDDQFGGWEVVRSPYADVDIRPGDVILAVNGRGLEHPLDFNLLWQDLRLADAIVVEVDRHGERFALRFEVVDGAAPASGAAAGGSPPPPH